MAGTPIDELITSLYEMVEDAWSVPLGADKCILERNKVLDILDEVRANLPSDIKMAQEIVEKRNEVIQGAKKEHDSIIQQAQDHARQRINDHEITLEARKKANEIVAAAENRAQELIKSACDYCEDAMHRTEDVLTRSIAEIKQSQAQFKSALREQQIK